jgi:hypothetical protein
MTARLARLAPLALAAVLAAALPVPAQPGEALGVAPGRVAVAGAQPGEAYVRTVALQHQFDSAGTIRVEVDGAEAAWVTTDPPSPFTMPARTNRAVTVTVAVPGAAPAGDHNTTLRFVRQSADLPVGSGASVQVSAGIHLAFSVGGEPAERISYGGGRVEDAAPGEPVRAFVRARNEGNVRATAHASGQVLPFADGAPALAAADGSLVLLPGEEGEVPLSFAAALEPGQYRARLVAGGVDTTLPFKVTPAGEAAPDGTLRAIVHVARASAGRPVDIHLWFENTGASGIEAAVARVEVRRGGAALATLESGAVALLPGQHANLTVSWTPPAAGTYDLMGRVTYDGYETPANANLLNAGPPEAPVPWWWLLAPAGAATAAVGGAWAWRRRHDRKAGAGKPPRILR